jgi:transposase InsO family protein/transposase
MAQNVYSWDIIHRFFPPEEIQKYRHQIINDWKSGLFKNEEIWEKYGMCENTFYELTKRYSEENDDGLKDKSKKPKNPFRKLEEEDVKIIIEKAQNERERIKIYQSEFERDMIQDGISFSESKLGGLKEKMNSAIHGVRRIAHEFNTDMLVVGRIINIGKSRVHEILASAKIYKQNNILNNKPKHLKRPEKPLQNFSMDFTQKRLGNGEIGYIFGLLDMHNDAFVELTGYPKKNGKIVVENLKYLRNIIPNEDKIEIRSDGGTEFNNAVVRDYCTENNIFLHIIPKASPWIQAFIERSFRTLKQELLNLVWIGNWEKFKDVLISTKFEYNLRPHSSFGYRSPFDIMNEAITNSPQHVCGH